MAGWTTEDYLADADRLLNRALLRWQEGAGAGATLRLIKASQYKLNEAVALLKIHAGD